MRHAPPLLLLVAGLSGFSLRAHSLALPEASSRVCDAAAREETAVLITERRWLDLRGHPCVPSDTLMLLEAGIEDPEDAVEFLGRGLTSERSNHERQPLSFLALGSSTSHCMKQLLPKVMYIGVGHSGSTTLADAMDKHPDLSYGRTKEHNCIWNYKGDRAKFLSEYREQFDVPCSKKVTFDSSPRTIYLGDKDDEQTINYPIAKKFGLGVGAVRAVKDVLGPDAKFIVMFRDPVPWAMSNGVQDVFEATELNNSLAVNRSNLGFGKKFLKGQTLTHGFFAKRACYANGLESWLQVFPRDSFLFLASENFFADPQSTYDQVCDFIGVPRQLFPEELKDGSGRRRSRQQHHHEAHERYHALPWAKDCKKKLELQTGIDFPWDDSSEPSALPADAGSV